METKPQPDDNITALPGNHYLPLSEHLNSYIFSGPAIVEKTSPRPLNLSGEKDMRITSNFVSTLILLALMELFWSSLVYGQGTAQAADAANRKGGDSSASVHGLSLSGEKNKTSPAASTRAKSEDYLAAASALVNAKQYEKALEKYQQAIRLRPTDADAHLGAAWVYNELGNYTEAMNAANKVISLRPGSAEAYNELGYAQRKLKNYLDAIKSYREALSLRPNFPLASFGLGDTYYYNTKEYPLALEAYRAGLQGKPEDAQVTYNVGWILNELSRFEESIPMFEKAQELKFQKTESIFYELGYAYFKLKRYPEAIKNYQQSLTIKPDYAVAYFGIGDVYFSGTKQYAEAAKSYEQGIRYTPDNATAQYRLGWCYNDLGKYQEALGPLREAVRLKPDNISAQIEFGYAQYQLKQYNDAIATFQLVISKDAKNSLAYYYLGLTYYVMGRRSEVQQIQQTLQGIDADRAKKLQDLLNKK